MGNAIDNLTKRVDLTRLYPPFLYLYLQALEAAHARGFDYYSISGFRDEKEQKFLYSKGRIERPDGTWALIDRAQVVTNARPWESDHNYGLGCDSCRDADTERDGLQPGWKIDDYEVLAQEGQRVGLVALFYSTKFREGPHLGLDIGRFGITHDTLHKLHIKGGMVAVWNALDGFKWKG